MPDAAASSSGEHAPAVHLSLLGPLRLEVDGIDRTPSAPVLQVLLAVLGTARGGPVAAERLAVALAQADGAAEGAGDADPLDDPDPAWLRALPAHVDRLRDLLGPAAGAVVHTAFGYQLQGAALRTDLDAVENGTRLARSATAAGDHAGAARALRRALDAWLGPVAADLPAISALTAIRADFERLRRDLVEDLAEARLSAGTPGVLARCVEDLESHLSRHPSRARAWGQLVVALHRAGRPAEALAAHRRSRAALAAVAAPGGPPGLAPMLEPDPVLRRLERSAADAAQDAEALDADPGDDADTAVPPALVWLDPEGRSRVHSLPRTGSVLIGRQPGADVRLAEASVSRAHAAVRRGRGGWWLLDLGSRLGTTLNGRPVTDGTRLRAGDVVCCGTAVLLADRPAAVLDVATATEVTAGYWDRQAARSGQVALR